MGQVAITEAGAGAGLQKSEQFLIEALMDLIAEKPWERITVADVCRRARVHRATFYDHFEGKTDLFERGLSMMFDELVARAAQSSSGMQGRFEIMLNHALAHKAFYLAVFAQGGPVRSLFSEYLTFHARQGRLVGSVEVDPRQELAIRFGAGGICAVLEWFLTASPALPGDEAAKLLARCLGSDQEQA